MAFNIDSFRYSYINGDIKMKYEKTTTPNLVIDKSTGTVLNTDTGGYESFKAARNKRKQELAAQDQIRELTEQVSLLWAEIRKMQVK
jgi:hypothetical protein